MNGLRTRGQNGPKVEKICGGAWKLMKTVGKDSETEICKGYGAEGL